MRHNARMLLAEPEPTPADLHFHVAGIRVRISPWFFLATALFGWGVCQSLARGDQRALLQFLVMWIGVVAGSILVHELGHALAYRAFGQAAHVVIYHFGGLAVPELWSRRHLRPLQRLLVSAAGPLAQLLVAAVVIIVLRIGGYVVPFPIAAVGERMGWDEGRPFRSLYGFALADFLLYVNVFWPLVNLVPVPPLDGGQIVREGLLAAGSRDAQQISGIIGVAAGGGMAWWAYTNGQPYLAILFAALAISCYQGLSADTPWRRWN